MTGLHAGVGRVEITPLPGCPQGGWGAQTHQRGLEADMPFYVRALVLSDGDERVAIADVDIIGFHAEWMTRILDETVRLTGFPRDRIRISSSHTHGGANTFRLATISEGRDMAIAYLESLPRRIASAVWRAQRAMKPVRAAAGTGSCDINVNRRVRLSDGSMCVGRNRDGVTDRAVRVLRFDQVDGAPAAAVVHYACHPTTTGWQSDRFTPDYPGPMRQVVERELGAPCLFLQGATGNIGPRQGFTGDHSVYRRLGTILGLEGARVAWNLDTTPLRERLTGVQPSGAPIALYADEPVDLPPQRLSVLHRRIELPARSLDPPEVLEREAERLRGDLERLRAGGSDDEIRAATAAATQAGWRAEYAHLYHGVKAIPWELMGIAIGPSIALLSTPGEPFIETAMAIQARSPFEHTWFSGYSNGGFGYIPTDEAFREGGYETEATPFSPGVAPSLEEAAAQLLTDLHETIEH